MEADRDKDRCVCIIAIYKLKTRNGRKLSRKKTKSITVEGIGKKQTQYLKLAFETWGPQSREEITP